jgi:uncharacterized protein involved in exopolysaccharide biosynthesis
MSDTEDAPKNGQTPEPEESVDLLDLALVLVEERWLIAKIVLASALLGAVLAIAPSAEYRSEAQLAPEGQQTNGNGGLSSIRQLGLDLGGAGGLGSASYPTVLKGRSVRLRTVRDTMQIARLDTSYVLADYLTRPRGFVERSIDFVARYTIGLPRRLLKAFEEDVDARGGASGEAGGAGEGTPSKGGAPAYPTRDEERAIRRLESMMQVSRSTATGFITVSARTGDPKLSSQIVSRLVHHFEDRVGEIRTEKARENLAFIEGQFEEAERELRRAEERLATFVDRNTGLQTAALRTERDRLQRQVSFKEELYRNLQSQLTEARLSLKRSEPVVTTIEEAVPPLYPSGPNRMIYLLGMIVLGGGGAVALVLGRTFIASRMEKSEEARAKVRELRNALIPRRLRNGNDAGRTRPEVDTEGRTEGRKK